MMVRKQIIVLLNNHICRYTFDYSHDFKNDFRSSFFGSSVVRIYFKLWNCGHVVFLHKIFVHESHSKDF